MLQCCSGATGIVLWACGGGLWALFLAAGVVLLGSVTQACYGYFFRCLRGAAEVDVETDSAGSLGHFVND